MVDDYFFVVDKKTLDVTKQKIFEIVSDEIVIIFKNASLDFDQKVQWHLTIDKNASKK